MRRSFAFVALLSSLLLASAAFAAETVKGTVKKVDEKASTVTFVRDGGKQEETLPVDKSVSLAKVKTNAKAQLTVDAGVVKKIEPGMRTGGY